MANEALKTGGAIFLLGYLLGRRKFRRAVQVGMFTATRQLGTSPRELLSAGVRRLAGSEEVRDAGKSIGSQLVMAALTAPAGRLADSLHRRNAELAGGGKRSERGDPEDGGEGEGDQDWQRRGPDRRAESGDGRAHDRRADDEGEDDWQEEDEPAPARRTQRSAARTARGSRGAPRAGKSSAPRRTARSGAGRQRGTQSGGSASRNSRTRQTTRATSGSRGGGRQNATASTRARRTRGR